ncbi:MAG: hypothetical protein OEX75_11450 [Gammaproteobacteria bacterium]|nr:hypothetical protein [Gammaproteobacteria bacterium]
MKKGEHMKYVVTARLCALVPVGLLIAGCSGEPTEADIRAIYEAEIAKTNEQMVKLGGEQAARLLGKSELHSITKLACKEADQTSGYNCDVQVDMSVPFLGRSTQMTTRRFVNSDNGWVVIDQ